MTVASLYWTCERRILRSWRRTEKQLATVLWTWHRTLRSASK